MASAIRKITLSGGSFWCLEKAFKQFKGIQSVMPGYTGGRQPQPTYQDVKAGKTDHVEIVHVEYNPNVIDTEKLLDIFFYLSDSSSGGREPTIFYHDMDQKVLSEKALDHMNSSGKKVVTQLKPAEKIYPAESEHVDYCNKHPEDEFCKTVVQPKIDKMSEKYKDLIKTTKTK